MKKYFFLGLVILFQMYSAFAQDKDSKIKIYRTWVTLNETPYKAEGVLYQIKDSAVILSNSRLINDYKTGNYNLTDFYVNSIQTIKIRKNYRVGNGMWQGALVGLVFGGMIGLMQGDDDKCNSSSFGGCVSFSAGEKALIFGGPTALLGAGIGAIFGSPKIEIPINGNKQKYKSNKEKLNNYTIKKK
jgi:hypothetical protein